MTEHINGKYTGASRNAGFVTPSVWIENDNKNFLGHKIANDWGLVTVISSNSTTLVVNYWSYKKAKFIMTWVLQEKDD